MIYHHLGLCLQKVGCIDEAIDTLRRAIRIDTRFRGVYNDLGIMLEAKSRLDDAIEQYQQALRIDSAYPLSRYNLGRALIVRGRLSEAIDHLKRAAEIKPDWVDARNELARALLLRGRSDEAIGHIREALRLDPRSSDALTHLAHALEVQGRPNEALAEGLKILRLNPLGVAANSGVHSLLMRVGGGAELRRTWQQALVTNPPDHNAWFGYAELCLFLGEDEEYRRARRDLLTLFGDSSDHYVAERTGRACLLLPAAGDELRQAVVLTDRAFSGRAPGWSGPRPYAQFAKGLAEYRLGRHESAIALMEQCAAGVKGPSPRLVEAMARHCSGESTLARKTLASAVLAFDWTAAKADSREPAWIAHILRREAEALILPDLQAFLEGRHQPRDNDERLALLGICQFKNLRATMAALYAASFASDPKLAEDLQAGHLYRAARAAAVAGNGGGADAAGLTEPEQARWRKQAREWLRAEITLCAGALDGSRRADLALVCDRLARLRADPDLAGLLNHEAIDRMPPVERQECRALLDAIDFQIRGAETFN